MRDVDDELGGEWFDAADVEHHGPHWEHRTEGETMMTQRGSTPTVQAMVRVSVVMRVEAMVRVSVVVTGTRLIRPLDLLGVGERDERDVAVAEAADAAGQDLGVVDPGALVVALGRQLAEHAVPEPHDGRGGMRDVPRE